MRQGNWPGSQGGEVLMQTMSSYRWTLEFARFEMSS